MIAKTITYKDFNDVERTETFYFHLSETELAEMEVSKHGLSEYFKRITDSKDTEEIMRAFKELLCMSYGVKSEDGRKFVKSEELTQDFVSTNAYNELFMELAGNEEAAIAFCNGIIPARIRESGDKPQLAANV